jgi:hypothetical protein
MFEEAGDIVETIPAAVASPFGVFRTRSVADGAVVNIEQGTARRLASEAVLNTFRNSRLEAQLLFGAVNPQLPRGMAVQGCRAAVWRVRAVVSLRQLVFESWWQEPALDADGGPDTGEGLDALTWLTPAGAVSLGTEDGEFLKYRALAGEAMPHSLVPQLDVSTIEYLPHGLRVPLQEVPAGSVVQVQFVVAWADSYTNESPSTWFAVEQRPTDLVRQLLLGTG